MGTRVPTRQKKVQAAKVSRAARIAPRSATASLPSLDRRYLVCGALLAAVTLAVYLRTLGNGFVSYDDIEYITGNDHIQHGVTWEMFTWAMSSTYAANWHPLTWISHALDCQMFGLHPAGHHFTNALLHAVSVLVLFFILARATGALGASLIVAALFALHPLNVETVAWASERKSVLSTLLFFLNLAAYGWYARRPDLRRYTAVVALFLLGQIGRADV